MSDDTVNDVKRPAYKVCFGEAFADMVAAKTMLMDNRPLEALQILNEAEERHRPHLPDYYTDTDHGENE